MNKNDLITAVSDSSGLSKSDASSAVEGVFDAITKSLSSGDEVRHSPYSGCFLSKPSNATLLGGAVLGPSRCWTAGPPHG